MEEVTIRLKYKEDTSALAALLIKNGYTHIDIKEVPITSERLKMDGNGTEQVLFGILYDVVASKE